MASTGSSTRSSGRIDVVLFNGRKIAVPVDWTTSFEDLRDTALQRASKSNIAIPPGELTMRLDCVDGTEAFAEDTVTDILSLDENPTVWLDSKSTAQVCFPSSWVAFSNSNSSTQPPKMMASSSVGFLQVVLLTTQPFLLYHLIRSQLQQPQQSVN
jgi:hypothetical protein